MRASGRVSFVHDERAIEGLPMHLVIIVVVAVAALAILIAIIPAAPPAALQVSVVQICDPDCEDGNFVDDLSPGREGIFTAKLRITDTRGAPVVGANAIIRGGEQPATQACPDSQCEVEVKVRPVAGQTLRLSLEVSKSNHPTAVLPDAIHVVA